jgi:hypothetical protein
MPNLEMIATNETGTILTQELKPYSKIYINYKNINWRLQHPIFLFSAENLCVNNSTIGSFFVHIQQC